MVALAVSAAAQSIGGSATATVGMASMAFTVLVTTATVASNAPGRTPLEALRTMHPAARRP
jgi:hypothetical protein